MSRIALFDRNRPLLFSISYRMLGSVMEAEDVVQEAFLRWQQAGEVRSPSAYLSAVVTRLCIDRLRSARTRREQYVGPWLPEPFLEDQEIEGSADLEDSLSMAFLALAAIMLDRRLLQVSLFAYHFYAVPHFVFHLTQTHAFSLGDNLAQLVSLGFHFVLPVALLLSAGLRCKNDGAVVGR